MDIEYEYRSFRVEKKLHEKLLTLYRQLGLENWELLRAPTVNSYPGQIDVCSGGIWIEARRVPYESSAPWSWEYIFFDVEPAPYGWIEHIQSCGWLQLDPPIHKYGGGTYCLFKRPGTWCGQDDGDVLSRLKEMGWSREDMNGFPRFDTSSEKPLNIASNILKVKWEQSKNQGRNIGTYNAVRWWLAHEYIPFLLQTNCIEIGDLFPGIGKLPHEALLDLLLSRREESVEKADVPSLKKLITNLRDSNISY